MKAQSDMDDRLLDEAIAWHRSLGTDDADWDGFTCWLEADPKHKLAFDEIVLTDRIVDEHKLGLRTMTASPRPHTRSVGRRGILYGSIAAAIAAVISVPALWPRAADKVYATSAGAGRNFVLAGGTAIALAPKSKLVVKAGDLRNLELAEGEAYFSVDHDPVRPLTIRAGRFAVSDIGTKFAVNVSGEALSVGVAEGHVVVAPASGGSRAQVAAGEQFLAHRGSTSIRMSRIAPKDVGSWRHGRLVYDNTPLAVVAADISRYSGKTLIVDPAIRDRRFSGVLKVGDGSGLLEKLSDFMGLSYKPDGDSVRIIAAAGH
jgi:transmembrane sensor